MTREWGEGGEATLGFEKAGGCPLAPRGLYCSVLYIFEIPIIKLDTKGLSSDPPFLAVGCRHFPNHSAFRVLAPGRGGWWGLRSGFGGGTSAQRARVSVALHASFGGAWRLVLVVHASRATRQPPSVTIHGSALTWGEFPRDKQS